MLEKALSGSRAYWSWIFALLLIIGGGVACWFWQFHEGLTITGLSRDVVWGFYIAQFTFLVGVAASAVMVVLPYYLHDYKAFGKMTILGEFLAIPAVIMCMAFIFVDMGMPNRIVNVFLHPTWHSMMFWDTVALGGYLVLNIIISHWTLSSERREEPPPKWLKPIILLSIPWAVSIHTVTAFLYAGLAARPFWVGTLEPRWIRFRYAVWFLVVNLVVLALHYGASRWHFRLLLPPTLARLLLISTAILLGLVGIIRHRLDLPVVAGAEVVGRTGGP